MEKCVPEQNKFGGNITPCSHVWPYFNGALLADKTLTRILSLSGRPLPVWLAQIYDNLHSQLRLSNIFFNGRPN